MRTGGLSFIKRFAGALLYPIFREEADERRFLAGLPVAMFATLFLSKAVADGAWGTGWLQFPGPNWILVIFALWWTAYLVKFWKRLKSRGELKRAIFGPTLFLALVLSVFRA